MILYEYRDGGCSNSYASANHWVLSVTDGRVFVLKGNPCSSTAQRWEVRTDQDVVCKTPYQSSIVRMGCRSDGHLGCVLDELMTSCSVIL